MTPKQAARLKERVEAAVVSVLGSEAESVSVEIRAIEPRDLDLAVHVRLPEPGDARERFLAAAAHFGLDERHYQAEFVWDEKSWVLVGLSPRHRKNPVEAIHVPSGMSRRLPLDALWCVQRKRKRGCFISYEDSGSI